MVESLGQYKILERIGAGGMGDVYRARDTRLGRTVAIKVLAASVANDPDRRDRFMREARASAALSHPNIAALYEVGEDQGELFLAFEFVPGETLRKTIGGRPMNPRRAIDLAVQIADALADAHAAGIIHRDIKPDNILVTPKGNAKILDFGLATWTSGGAEREHAADQQTLMVTGAGTTMGTVAYMSPEQALGERVDHRTDIFSLGIVLYEMLTGKLPFNGTTSTAMALQIVQASAPRPSSVNRALPVELDAIVTKMLAKSLDQRYESAATLAAELRSIGAILDVRTEREEKIQPVIAAGRSRSWIGPLLLVAILAALAATAWFERAPLMRLYRHTFGPAPAPVIAVVPFETDRDQTFFADGLADDLITRLGQTQGLKVIGRSATRSYRGRAPVDVARELGAGVVLTGSVRPSGDAVKVSLELVDPSDGTDLWTNQFTRDVKDIFAVQADVAEQVAQALRLKLQPTAASARTASRLVDRRAYELYLQGRQAIAERRTAAAIDLYQRAVAADSGLAEAHAGLAYALHLSSDSVEAERQLQAAAERAIQLDPDLPEANLAMGLAAPSLAKTLEFLRKTVALDPSFAEAYHQIGDQIQDVDPERSLAFYRKALELDPQLDITYADEAISLAELNRFPEAYQMVALDAQALARRGQRDFAAEMRLTLYLHERQFAKALAEAGKIAGLRSDPSTWWTYALALQSSGRTADAWDEVSRVIERFPGFCNAKAMYAGLALSRAAKSNGLAIAAALIRDAHQPGESSDALRCGVAAAAATNNPDELAALVRGIAADETRLRAWGRALGAEPGRYQLVGRPYPYGDVMEKPIVVDAMKALDAAYDREREVVKTALSGLLQ